MTPDTPTSLWLLRHPEPEESARGRCYGSLDVDLSAQGLRQAHAVAAYLEPQTFAAIYTSPRRRCRQAAAILAMGRECAVEALEPLAELHFGDLEGRTYEEIASSYPDLYRQWMERPTETAFPGGETFQDMRLRVTEAASMLRARHAGQTIALMTHAGAIRILLAEALGMPPTNIFRIGLSYAGVNLIRYFGDFPVVELLNFPVTKHL
jgi:alpha-ribazole phosphatase